MTGRVTDQSFASFATIGNNSRIKTNSLDRYKDDFITENFDVFYELLRNLSKIKIEKIGFPDELLKQSISSIEELLKKDGEYLLSLKENWDSEGALAISESIYNRAKSFIIEFSKCIVDNIAYIKTVTTPILTPLNDGSIDVLWKNESSSLLINFNNTVEYRAYYYGQILDVNKKITFDCNGKINPIKDVYMFLSRFIFTPEMEDDESC
jgi:hypothetical protein